jgi:PTH1 family peptidyl-tRNA hydrolase
MLLFVGLGNPGAQHAGNRHNIGFMVVRAIAKAHNFDPWRRGFQGLVTEGLIGSGLGTSQKIPDLPFSRWPMRMWPRQSRRPVPKEGPVRRERVLLLLPGTFMNESGRAVGEAAHFYKLGLENVTVFHDEIELALGKVRVKTGGSNAGHNGLRSISSHIGNDYRRVRFGIGHPGVKDLVYDYVLSDFARSERACVEALCELSAENAELLANGQEASFQNKIHLGLQARGFFDSNGSE